MPQLRIAPWIFALLCLPFGAGNALAQETPGKPTAFMPDTIPDPADRARSSTGLRGSVRQGQSSQALAATRVVLLNAKQELIASDKTDHAGRFRLEAPSGKYLLQVQNEAGQARCAATPVEIGQRIKLMNIACNSPS